jgi:hypothetical protein
MGRPTKEESERRKAALLNLDGEIGDSTPPEQTPEPAVGFAEEETEAIEKEIEEVKETPSPFGLNPNDVKNYLTHQFETDKKMAIDAIEQAVKDAVAIAANKVRVHPVTVELLADIANVDKRRKFLAHFGPTKLVPPRPIPGPDGHKDEACLKWDATYEPEDFIRRFSHSKAPLIRQLIREIENRNL